MSSSTDSPSTDPPSTDSPSGAGSRGGPATRERILDAATQAFYAGGIRATSADRIIEQVGVTKVTFYRHFRSKTDLAVAYLQRQANGERAMLEAARIDADARGALATIAATIGTAACQPGFRGCPFINAAAEFPDPADPVRVVVEEHRRWTREFFAGLASDAGVRDVESVAAQLMMLRDGAMVGGYLGDPDTLAATLQAACATVLARD